MGQAVPVSVAETQRHQALGKLMAVRRFEAAHQHQAANDHMEDQKFHDMTPLRLFFDNAEMPPWFPAGATNPGERF